MTKSRTNADNVTADIAGITAGTGITGGGTSGTVTITNDMATTIAAKGDLLAGTANDAYSAITVGANGTVLTAASGQATGLSWATPSSGALVLTGSADFTASQSIIISNCFSSTYDYYVAYINFSNISGAQTTLRGRLRVGGTSSTTNYRWTQSYVGGSSPGYAHDDADTSFRMGEIVAAPNHFSCAMIMNFIDPGIARVTKHITPHVFYSGATSYQMNFAGTHNSPVAYTDLDLFPSTAIDITGQVRVYGHAKS